MPRIDCTRSDALLCPRCGTRARLFGIEAHPTVTGADLHTYVCGECDGLQTELVLRPVHELRAADIPLGKRS